MMRKTAVLILAGAALLAASALRSAAEPPPVTKVAVAHLTGALESFPSYGIKFTGPKGWDRVPEGGVNRIARWIQTGPDGKGMALMQIEHAKFDGGPATAQTADLILKREVTALEKSMTIKSLRNYKVDGEWGFIVQASSAKSTMQLFETFRGDVKYVTSITRPKADKATTVVQEDSDLINEFRENWKWRELEEPFEHIHFMAQSLPVLGGLMRINVPITARPDVTDSPKTQVHFAIVNLKRQDDEFRVYVNLEETPPIPRDDYSAMLAKKLSLAVPPAWTSVDGHYTITPWVKSSIADKPIWMAFSVVPLSANRTAMATFALDRDEENVQDAYMAVAKRISLSIEPGPQTAEAH